MAVLAFRPGPGAFVLAFWCDDVVEWDEFRASVEARTFTYDGQHVEERLDPASDRFALFIRMRLCGPYVPAPLVLRFEDVEVAERIGATGWYTFEGGLYRADHLGEGRVVLDRVYESEPPPQYHGHTLAKIEALDTERSET